LYLDQDRFADPTLSVRGGIPILFPICGNLPNNTYTYGGRAFQLKQHGFARDRPWQILTHTATSLALVLGSSPETLAQYPFEFNFTLTYRLEESSLLIQSQITNLSQDKMPFSLGFHPYFAVADKAQLTFDLPATEMMDHLTQLRQPFTGQVNVTAPELDMALFPVSSSRATMQGEYRLELTSDPSFTTLVVWTVAGKPYVCLEPWTAQRNALNTGVDLLELLPGASMQAAMRLAVQASLS
jgi:galactose mutarotase-like enzyme